MHSALNWLFRDRKTGRIVVAQKPNAALIAFLILRIAAAITSAKGTAGNLLDWAGSAALAWWALDELLRGVNPFRRALGAVALGVLGWSLIK